MNILYRVVKNRIIQAIGLIVTVYVAAFVLSTCGAASIVGVKAAGGGIGSADASVKYASVTLLSEDATLVVGERHPIALDTGGDNNDLCVDAKFIKNSANAKFVIEGKNAYITLRQNGTASLFILYTTSYTVTGSKSGSSTYYGLARTKVVTYSTAVSTRGEPINTAEELQNMQESGSYYLANDIDCSRISFKTIEKFYGTLQGNGHSIKNLAIDATYSTNIGMFGILYGAITNINFVNCYVAVQKSCTNIGIIAGTNNGNISGCTLSGGVAVSNASSKNVGGAVGKNNSIIRDSVSSVKVNGLVYTGGFVGRAGAGSSHKNLVNNAPVSGSGNVGGIVGGMDDGGFAVVNNSANYGLVSGGSGACVGGLVGWGNKSVVSFSKNYGNVTGRRAIGGIIGNGDEIEQCENNGNITQTIFSSEADSRWVGGIAGYANSVNKSVNNGDIGYVAYLVPPSFTGLSATDATYFGGVAGEIYASSSNNTNNGNVTARSQVGGVFGKGGNGTLTSNKNYGSVVAQSGTAGGILGEGGSFNISASLNMGNVSGTTAVGGILGKGTSPTIGGCVNHGTVTGSGNGNTTSGTGGIVGKVAAVQINNAENFGNVNGAFGVGGIVGSANDNSASLDGCTNDGAISGSYACGGIAGDFYGEMDDSTNNGSITGVELTGGIAGSVRIVLNSTNHGLVDGITYTGGIAGQVVAKAEGNENWGSITATGTYTGGIVGYANGGTYLLNNNRGTVMSSSTDVGGVIGNAYAASKIAQNTNRASITGGAKTGGIIGSRKSNVTVDTTNVNDGEVKQSGVIIPNTNMSAHYGTTYA